MRIFIALLVISIAVAACSGPKKTETKTPSTTITRHDLFLGGTSFKTALVIEVRHEGEGIREEYKWLSNSYPGYGMIRRTHVKQASKHFDIVRIKTKQKELKDVYFDSTSFWGKP